MAENLCILCSTDPCACGVDDDTDVSDLELCEEVDSEEEDEVNQTGPASWGDGKPGELRWHAESRTVFRFEHGSWAPHCDG